jgi:hypothetical protein
MKTWARSLPFSKTLGHYFHYIGTNRSTCDFWNCCNDWLGEGCIALYDMQKKVPRGPINQGLVVMGFSASSHTVISSSPLEATIYITRVGKELITGSASR